MKKLALFASGSGSNVENIVNFFSDRDDISIEFCLTNNPNAFVVNRCEKLGIPCIVFTRDEIKNGGKVLEMLLRHEIDLIVLAGYLWLVPIEIIKAFQGKIINIHPALLPKYGGKGMYGMNVHKAVVENKERESGITIHFVNEKFDEGKHIFQAKCKLLPSDTPDEVAAKVHELEYTYFPEIIDRVLKNL